MKIIVPHCDLTPSTFTMLNANFQRQLSSSFLPSLSFSFLLFLSVSVGIHSNREGAFPLRRCRPRVRDEPLTSHIIPFIHPLYTLYTPFIHLHYTIDASIYTRCTCIQPYTPNTPLNTSYTPHNTPYIYAYIPLHGRYEMNGEPLPPEHGAPLRYG